METQKQIEYKAYLTTDHWKNKRLEVLETRGCKCEKCGEWGNEIHHITYDNLWNELLSDLMVLCRDCHEATHKALRSLPKEDRYTKKRKSIHRMAVYSSLSNKQKEHLIKKYQIKDAMLHYILGTSNSRKHENIIRDAVRMIGMDTYYPIKAKFKIKKSIGRGPNYGRRPRK